MRQNSLWEWLNLQNGHGHILRSFNLWLTDSALPRFVTKRTSGGLWFQSMYMIETYSCLLLAFWCGQQSDYGSTAIWCTCRSCVISLAHHNLCRGAPTWPGSVGRRMLSRGKCIASELRYRTRHFKAFGLSISLFLLLLLQLLLLLHHFSHSFNSGLNIPLRFMLFFVSCIRLLIWSFKSLWSNWHPTCLFTYYYLQ